jgi:cytochrome c biogenesis protein CcmG/thiol:disulfide interchange protein DsbE
MALRATHENIFQKIRDPGPRPVQCAAGYDGPVSPTKTTKNNRPLIFGAALIAVLALIAFFATRSDDSGSVTDGNGSAGGGQTEETGTVAVDGQPLAELNPEGNDPAVGQTAPSLEGTSFDGSAITIEPGSEPKLVVFVAHWCPHCQREVPKIVSWLEDSGTPEGLEMMVVATATDENRPNYPPSEWLDEEGLDLPAMADDSRGTAAEAYGLSGYPYFVLLDADNKVIARDTGELSTDELDGLVEMAGTSS